MRINELPLVVSPSLSRQIQLRNLGSSIELGTSPIVFLLTNRGCYTWRGVGQTCPTNSEIMATGCVVFSPDSEALEVCLNPVYSPDVDYMVAHWKDANLFTNHFFVPRGDPVRGAIWFVHD